VSFFLSPDGIHPGPTGHWLIAQAILLAWNAPAEVSVAEVDAAGGAVVAGEIADLEVGSDGLAFRWTTRLPMPRHEKWDAESLELEQFDGRFNELRLRVRNAPAGRYVLLLDGAEMGSFSRAQLARGIEVSSLPGSPAHRRAAQVMEGVAERQKRATRSWFSEVRAGGTGLAAHESAELRQLDAELRRLARPMVLQVRLRSLPAEG